MRMRFLFTTLQTYESDFYGRVGAELVQRGHEVAHVTVSRRAARLLREQGFEAQCLPDLVREAGSPPDPDAEVRRIEGAYEMPHIRDVYRADWACSGRPEQACIRRTVDHFRALELAYDRIRPDTVVPEVGNETIRIATHLIGMARGIPVLFLLYTIFPDPLRLTVDTLHAPIVDPADLRELTEAEAAEVEAFRSEFNTRAQPIRQLRRVPVEWRRVGLFADHVVRRLREERDNDYLRPGRLLAGNVSEWVRARAARPFYDRLDAAAGSVAGKAGDARPQHRGAGRAPGRPYVYFPLHVTDDYKITRIIPHCAEQVSLVEQVADALPPGYDVVLKEHPMSVGRNSLRLLRRLRRRANVRLVPPSWSSHELIKGSAAVAVISSTVGLEALLYEKPVLTLGQPFYSGYGTTLDVDSFAELREKVPQLLRFRPDPELIRRFLHAAMRACLPGAPVLVDRSDENAVALAGSIESVAARAVGVPAATGRTPLRTLSRD